MTVALGVAAGVVVGVGAALLVVRLRAAALNRRIDRRAARRAVFLPTAAGRHGRATVATRGRWSLVAWGATVMSRTVRPPRTRSWSTWRRGRQAG